MLAGWTFLLLGSVGATLIICYSKLFARVRSFVHKGFRDGFLYCGQCVGFWVGLVFGSAFLAAQPERPGWPMRCLFVFTMACATSVVGVLVELWLIEHNGPAP